MLHAVLAFAFALIVATLVEYWGHRLMHGGRLLRVRHAGHHKRGTGQGFLGELRDYGLLPALTVSWSGFLISPGAGIGFLVGSLGHAVFAAWAHQLQHERPSKVFWMKQPIHAVHHAWDDWHHNFGITTDVWDRVFGTYLERPPLPELDALDRDGGFGVRWASPSEPLPRARRLTGAPSPEPGAPPGRAG